MFNLLFICLISCVNIIVGGVLCSLVVLVRFRNVLLRFSGLICGVSLFIMECICCDILM